MNVFIRLSWAATVIVLFIVFILSLFVREAIDFTTFDDFVNLVYTNLVVVLFLTIIVMLALWGVLPGSRYD